jgi:hypothetical protein
MGSEKRKERMRDNPRPELWGSWRVIYCEWGRWCLHQIRIRDRSWVHFGNIRVEVTSVDWDTWVWSSGEKADLEIRIWSYWHIKYLNHVVTNKVKVVRKEKSSKDWVLEHSSVWWWEKNRVKFKRS